MADSVLQLILRTVKQGNAPADVTRDLEKLEGAAKKTSGGLGALAGAARLAAAAGIGFLSSKAVQFVGESLKLGIEVQRAERALEGMTGGSRQAADALDAVREASGGALDRLSAMQNATRLFSMGLADNAEEAGRLTQIAITLGATMGKGPQEAFEEFTLLLANQSILRLDTFGISGGRVRERMAELAEEMPNATRETRFLTAVMEEADAKMGALADAGFEATSSVDVLNARVTDLKLNFATLTADGLVPMLDRMVLAQDAIIALDRALEDGLITNQEYGAQINFIRVNASEAEQVFDFLASKTAELQNLMQSGVGIIDGWESALRNSAGAAGEASGAFDAVVVSLSKLTTAEIGRKALDALNERFRLTGDLEEYELGLRAIGTRYLGLSEDQVVASIAIERLSEDFRVGEGDLFGYLDTLGRFDLAINSLPTSKDIFITTHFRTVGGAPSGLFTPSLGQTQTLPRTTITERERAAARRGLQFGGVVGAREPVLVGERGPEVFIPPSAGRVEPIQGGATGGATVNFNGPITIGSEMDMLAFESRLRRALRR